VDIRKLFLAVLLSFVILPVLPLYADEPKKIDELGIDEKLQRVYELYRLGETVSLKPRQFRLTVGGAYAFDDKNEIGVHSSNRSLSLQGSLAYGITDWLETSVTVPIGWNQNRLETSDETLVDTSVAGLGDVGFQLIATLPVKAFELTGVFGLTLPTGRKGIGGHGIQSHIGLNVAKVLQPAFLFGGLAWQHDWRTGLNGINYSGGVGFFLNHSLSLGVELSGTRFLNPSRGGIADTAVATLQLSYQITPTLGITPYVSHGLTKSAPDVAFGFSITRRF
jgi:hypothetical protein